MTGRQAFGCIGLPALVGTHHLVISHFPCWRWTATALSWERPPCCCHSGSGDDGQDKSCSLFILSSVVVFAHTLPLYSPALLNLILGEAEKCREIEIHLLKPSWACVTTDHQLVSSVRDASAFVLGSRFQSWWSPHFCVDN